MSGHGRSRKPSFETCDARERVPTIAVGRDLHGFLMLTRARRCTSRRFFLLLLRTRSCAIGAEALSLSGFPFEPLRLVGTRSRAIRRRTSKEVIG